MPFTSVMEELALKERQSDQSNQPIAGIFKHVQQDVNRCYILERVLRSVSLENPGKGQKETDVLLQNFSELITG